MRRITHHFVIEAIALLTFLAMIWTGLIMRYVLPPGSQRSFSLWGQSRHEWGDIHFYVALGLAAIVLYHLVQHVGWIWQVILGWLGRRGHAAWHSHRARNGAAAGLFVLIAMALAGLTRLAQTDVIADDSHRRGDRSSVEVREDSNGDPDSEARNDDSSQRIRRRRRTGSEQVNQETLQWDG